MRNKIKKDLVRKSRKKNILTRFKRIQTQKLIVNYEDKLLDNNMMFYKFFLNEINFIKKRQNRGFK